MKKIFTGILVIIMVLCMLGGCSSGDEIESSTEPIVVVTEDKVAYAEPTEKEEVPIETSAPEVETTQEPESTESIVEETAPAPTEAPKTLVYTTPEGEKYHTASCRWVKNKELTEWTIADAINAGYDSCGTCKPH